MGPKTKAVGNDCPACGPGAIGCPHRPAPSRGVALGRLIRAQREAAGLGLNEVARRLGVSGTWLSRVELAQHGAGIPSSARLVQLAEILGADEQTCDHWHRVGGRIPSDVLEQLFADLGAVGRVREKRAPKKPRAPVTLKLNTYAILDEAVSRGAKHGVARAFKHDDKPTPEAIAEHVQREVMTALSEVVDFGEGS